MLFVVTLRRGTDVVVTCEVEREVERPETALNPQGGTPLHHILPICPLYLNI